MAHILAAAGDFRIERNDFDSTVTVHVRADKVPNKHGYGFALESGNVTRSWARKMARKYLTAAEGERINVSGIVGTHYVGRDLYRSYIVTGAAA